jgi:hypothetical protein
MRHLIRKPYIRAKKRTRKQATSLATVGPSASKSSSDSRNRQQFNSSNNSNSAQFSPPKHKHKHGSASHFNSDIVAQSNHRQPAPTLPRSPPRLAPSATHLQLHKHQLTILHDRSVTITRTEDRAWRVKALQGCRCRGRRFEEWFDDS